MTMQALSYNQFGGRDVLEMKSLPIPVVNDDEVLIRTHAASLNVFDWKLRSGGLQAFFNVEFPVTPGRDGCGEVIYIGKNARLSTSMSSTRLAKGQRVAYVASRVQQGTHADFVAVNASFVTPVPTDADASTYAALPLVGLSAWNALVDTAQLKPGMKILIHGGAGGVGSVAVQLAAHLGAKVYATCSSAKMPQVEQNGATAIPYDEVDFRNVIDACDVVFDTIGGEVHENSYDVLKEGGRLVYLLAKPFGVRKDGDRVDTRQVIVLNRTENLRQVIDLASRGVLRASVGHVFRLGAFREAFALAESGKAGGKVVFKMTS